MTYHIKKDGTPGICRAKNNNCPYGDISEHFPTIEEAQIHADKLNEQRIKRDKLGREYIRNSYFDTDVNKIVDSVLDSIPKLKSGAPAVKYSDDDYEKVTITDNGIKVSKRINVAVSNLSSEYPIYANSNVNIYFDLDNINKIKFDVDEDNKGLYRHTVVTPLGHDIRGLSNDEEDTLKNYESKIKNKLSKKKKDIKEAIYENNYESSNNEYIYNDLNKFNGKEVSEVINSINSDLYYEIISNNKKISEGRDSNGDFDVNILKSKVKGFDVSNPGDSQSEIVKLYI